MNIKQSGEYIDPRQDCPWKCPDDRLYCNCRDEKMKPLKEEKKCVAGCMHFTGGELRHHKDCPYYSESLSEEMDRLRESLQKAQEENKILKQEAELGDIYWACKCNSLKAKIQSLEEKILNEDSYEGDYKLLHDKLTDTRETLSNVMQENQRLQSEIERLKGLFPECWKAAIDYQISLMDFCYNGGKAEIKPDFEQWKKEKGT